LAGEDAKCGGAMTGTSPELAPRRFRPPNDTRPVPTGRGARREGTHEEKGGKVESTSACDAEERMAVYLCIPTTPTEQNVMTLRRKRRSAALQE
jgi:hypothetical protein